MIGSRARKYRRKIKKRINDNKGNIANIYYIEHFVIIPATKDFKNNLTKLDVLSLFVKWSYTACNKYYDIDMKNLYELPDNLYYKQIFHTKVLGLDPPEYVIYNKQKFKYLFYSKTSLKKKNYHTFRKKYQVKNGK